MDILILTAGNSTALKNMISKLNIHKFFMTYETIEEYCYQLIYLFHYYQFQKLAEGSTFSSQIGDKSYTIKIGTRRGRKDVEKITIGGGHVFYTPEFFKDCMLKYLDYYS